MYTMYGIASNNTPYNYNHVSLYMVWIIHPRTFILEEFLSIVFALNNPISEGGIDLRSQISKLPRAKIAIEWHYIHDYGKFYAHLG